MISNDDEDDAAAASRDCDCGEESSASNNGFSHHHHEEEGTNTSGPSNTASDSRGCTTTRQSLEEFVASQQQEQNLLRRSSSLPPSNIAIHVPPAPPALLSDQSSCASSITMHARDDDLFVPSIYPSLLRTVLENTTVGDPPFNYPAAATTTSSSGGGSTTGGGNSNLTSQDTTTATTTTLRTRLPSLVYESNHRPSKNIVDNNMLRTEKEKISGKTPYSNDYYCQSSEMNLLGNSASPIHNAGISSGTTIEMSTMMRKREHKVAEAEAGNYSSTTNEKGATATTAAAAAAATNINSQAANTTTKNGKPATGGEEGKFSEGRSLRQPHQKESDAGGVLFVDENRNDEPAHIVGKSKEISRDTACLSSRIFLKNNNAIDDNTAEANNNDDGNTGEGGGVTTAFARIMAMNNVDISTMILPNDTNHNFTLAPREPGAYPISAAPGGGGGGNYHFRQQQQQQQQPQGTEQQDQSDHHYGDNDNLDQLVDSDYLVEARPIIDDETILPSFLQIATPQDHEEELVISSRRRRENTNGAEGTMKKWLGFSYQVRKPKVSSTRAGRMCLVAAIVAVSLAAAAIVIGVNNLLSAPDPAKIKYDYMRAAVLQSFGKDYFDNEQKERALRWMAFEDPRQQSSSSSVLTIKEEGQDSTNNNNNYHYFSIQRYSLVAFYFQSSFQNPWSFCTPPLEGQSSLCYYVPSVEMRKKRPSDLRSIRWLSAAHECEWMGVTCTKATTGGTTKTVTELSLGNNNITGTLSEEIYMLTNLQTLAFCGNHLSSTLPTWVSELSDLEVLDFRTNEFTGTLPQEYLSLPKLKWILLPDNLLTGPIPVSSPASNLERINLANNMFSGQFLPVIYSLTRLRMLWLYNNNLTGPLSPQLGKLSDLTILWLDGNQFLAGSIPSEIAVAKSLSKLHLEGTSIGGSIPDTLYDLSYLSRVGLSRSKISGTISPRIGQLTNLREFSVADTHISGTIPEEISLLSKTLAFLHLEKNAKLTGSIPNGYCLKRQQRLAIETPEVVADCTPSPSTGGVPSVACPDGCCTSCCDADTEICLDQ